MSLSHTGAGTLNIESAGQGVSVQSVNFQAGSVNLPAGASLSLAGQERVNAKGFYLGVDTVLERGHMNIAGEAYLPNLPGSDNLFPVGLEFNHLLPCPVGASFTDCEAHPMYDGTLSLTVPGGIFINGINDDPMTSIDETTPPRVHAYNGIQIFTGPTGVPDNSSTPEDESVGGVALAPGGGAWDTLSDARRKTDWEKADPELFLRGIAGMNIQSWRYKAQTSDIRHVGPTAQDFRAAFGLGTNDTTISTVDADGANMLAIQALAKRTDELKAATERITELEKRLAAIESLLREMKRQ